MMAAKASGRPRIRRKAILRFRHRNTMPAPTSTVHTEAKVIQKMPMGSRFGVWSHQARTRESSLAGGCCEEAMAGVLSVAGLGPRCRLCALSGAARQEVSAGTLLSKSKSVLLLMSHE